MFCKPLNSQRIVFPVSIDQYLLSAKALAFSRSLLNLCYQTLLVSHPVGSLVYEAILRQTENRVLHHVADAPRGPNSPETLYEMHGMLRESNASNGCAQSPHRLFSRLISQYDCGSDHSCQHASPRLHPLHNSRFDILDQNPFGVEFDKLY
jgi:hypothetical protein